VATLPHRDRPAAVGAESDAIAISAKRMADKFCSADNRFATRKIATDSLQE
jgi:hypothetical protein